MKKIINIVLFVFTLSLALNAQVFTANLEAGDAAFDRGDYYKAMSYFEEALAYENEDYDLWFKYAESARLFDSYAKADEAYEKLSEVEDHANHLQAIYNRALVKKFRGEYEKSSSLFEVYLGNENKDSLMAVQAKKLLEDNQWAIQRTQDGGQDFEIEILSDNVNSSYSEFSPYKVNDILYFTSSRESEKILEEQDVQKILIQSNEEQAFILSGDINKIEEHTGHFTLSSDGARAYFTICKQGVNYELNCHIYAANKDKDGQWQNPIKLPANINTPEATSTQPNIGLDKDGNEILYFVSNRAEGLGALDVWYSPIKNGTYEGPYNLSEINTVGDDISPFFDSKGQILYFSTDGLLTLGGLDVYSVKQINGKWQEAKHLGLPVNSSYNDAFYSIDDQSNQAFFSSNRLASKYIDDLKEACCYDIYKATRLVNVLDLLALTFDKESEDPLEGVTLEVRKKEVSDSENYFDKDATEYLLKVEDREIYEIVAKKDGYETERLTVNVSEQETESKIFLRKEAPEIVSLSNIVYNENNEPLYSISYCVENLRTDSTFCRENLSKNAYSLILNPKDDYLIITKRAGYQNDSTYITGKELVAEAGNENIIKLKSIALPPVTKLTLDAYLPMPLYFDNDQPDNKTLSKTTLKTYGQSNVAYYARKNTFINEFTQGLTGEAKTSSAYELETFFEQKVRGGNNSLEDFTSHLLRYLQQGNKASIILKGFASPRAQSTYNNNLTMRRVSSMRNHFNQYQGGALIPYLNNGMLQVLERAFGENNADQSVSDDVSDTKNSIYSVEASLERRVEILEIKTN